MSANQTHKIGTIVQMYKYQHGINIKYTPVKKNYWQVQRYRIIKLKNNNIGLYKRC